MSKIIYKEIIDYIFQLKACQCPNITWCIIWVCIICRDGEKSYWKEDNRWKKNKVSESHVILICEVGDINWGDCELLWIFMGDLMINLLELKGEVFCCHEEKEAIDLHCWIVVTEKNSSS